MTPIPSQSRSAGLLCAAVAALTFWPLLANLSAFRRLFYFQDEWDLIDLWDKEGFLAWVSTTFAENFVPLFKLAWGGSIIAFGGSYFALVLLLWLTHALNVWLVFRIAQRLSANALAGAFAAAIFGLAWVNYETLTWTIQWSAVLSLSFFLLGIDQIVRWSEGVTSSWGRIAGTLALCSAASALCFSRGVLTGLVFAAWVVMAKAPFLSRKQQLAAALAAAIPSAVVAWWIFRHSPGNHHSISGAMGAMMEYAFYYYAQAPLRTLWSYDTPGTPALLLLAATKTAIFGLALYIVPPRLRAALIALWLFELGNALLLGLGRHHTGLGTSGNSRYQYGALAVFLPACSILFEKVFRSVPARWQLRTALGAATVLIAAWFVQRPWNDAVTSWSEDHGASLRRILFQNPPAKAPDHFTGLPWMTNERSWELVDRYGLH